MRLSTCLFAVFLCLGFNASADVRYVDKTVTAVFSEVAAEGEGELIYVDVSVEEGYALWEADVFTLDVRSRSEFEAGHIPGAYNVNVDQLPGRIDELAHLKDDTVLVYCGSGGRSAIASQQLVDEGFSGIRNLISGFAAWTNAGYPVATGGEGEGEGEGEGLGCSAATVDGAGPRRAGQALADGLVVLLAGIVLAFGGRCKFTRRLL